MNSRLEIKNQPLIPLLTPPPTSPPLVYLSGNILLLPTCLLNAYEKKTLLYFLMRKLLIRPKSYRSLFPKELDMK